MKQPFPAFNHNDTECANECDANRPRERQGHRAEHALEDRHVNGKGRKRETDENPADEGAIPEWIERKDTPVKAPNREHETERVGRKCGEDERSDEFRRKSATEEKKVEREEKRSVEERDGEDERPASPVEERSRGRTTSAAAVAPFKGERDGGKAVRKKIHEQNLERVQRKRDADHERAADEEEFIERRGEEVHHDFANVSENGTALLDGGGERFEIIIEDNKISGAFCDIGARADRHPDIGRTQRGRVVDAVPRYRDHLAALLEKSRDADFIGRGGARVHRNPVSPRAPRLVGNPGKLAPRHHRARAVNQTKLARNGLRSPLVISGYHDRANARATHALDRGLCLRPQRVAERDDSGETEPRECIFRRQPFKRRLLIARRNANDLLSGCGTPMNIRGDRGACTRIKVTEAKKYIRRAKKNGPHAPIATGKGRGKFLGGVERRVVDDPGETKHLGKAQAFAARATDECDLERPPDELPLLCRSRRVLDDHVGIEERISEQRANRIA